MAKLQPKSYKIGQTLSTIKVKELYNSEEIVLITQDSVNDNEIYVATNPNSTDVRTVELTVTATAVIQNNYTDFTGTDYSDNIITYSSADPTGIIAGETVTISQGIALYQTTVSEIDGFDIKLNEIDGEEGFVPVIDDILIFNHSTWYYVTADDISKVAIGDKFKVTLDDDGTIQILEVLSKDATHIGFKKVTTNYAVADVITFESKHSTVTPTSNNLAIIPKSEYNQAVKFFF